MGMPKKYVYLLKWIFSLENVLLAFQIIGAIVVTLKVITFLKSLNRYFFRGTPDIKSKYQLENSWVMISGGSDGVGRAFGVYFAKLGFNICITGRDDKKLSDLEKEIKKIDTSLKVLALKTDYAQTAKDDKLYDEIEEKIKDLDIAVLVNSAGVLRMGYHHEVSESDQRELFNTNCVSHAIVSRMVIPKMMTREKRGAIIAMSSFAGEHYSPLFALYGATKGFMHSLFYSLSETYKRNIDVLVFNPMFISTALLNYKKEGFLCLSPKKAVSECLRHLGRERATCASWRYAVHRWINDQLPLSVFLSSRKASIDSMIKKKFK